MSIEEKKNQNEKNLLFEEYWIDHGVDFSSDLYFFAQSRGGLIIFTHFSEEPDQITIKIQYLLDQYCAFLSNERSIKAHSVIKSTEIVSRIVPEIFLVSLRNNKAQTPQKFGVFPDEILFDYIEHREKRVKHDSKKKMRKYQNKSSDFVKRTKFTKTVNAIPFCLIESDDQKNGEADSASQTGKETINKGLEKYWHMRYRVYGVQDNIDFIRADALYLINCIKSDACFSSPPWGGPSYIYLDSFNVATDLVPSAFEIFKNLNPSCKSAALYLPRNVAFKPLKKIAKFFFNGVIEVEKNFLNKKLVACTVYFGDSIIT
ncbi:hypothetical protein MXB_3306 [Myxobolus squamalis]|nr:hypothetical protein MXB_3306 [Myxobolus squamalis]